MKPATLPVMAVLGAAVLSVAMVTGRAFPTPELEESPGPPWITDVVARSGPGSAQPFTMRLVIAVDEEFVRARGASWVSDARAVVLTASDLMGEIGIGLAVTGVTRWESKPGRLPDLVGDVVAETGLPPDAVLVALTSQSSNAPPAYDGWASASRPVIVIKVTDPTRSTLPSLVTHELGHILGLDEHGADHQGSDEGCVMVASGYRDGDRWCAEDLAAVARILDEIP